MFERAECSSCSELVVASSGWSMRTLTSDSAMSDISCMASSARHCSRRGWPKVWFSGLLRTASDDVDAYGESARRTSEFVRERTRSIDEREAAPMDAMSDWARERATSESDVPELVREREFERDAPECDRDPFERR